MHLSSCRALKGTILSRVHCLAGAKREYAIARGARKAGGRKVHVTEVGPTVAVGVAPGKGTTASPSGSPRAASRTRTSSSEGSAATRGALREKVRAPAAPAPRPSPAGVAEG